MRLLLQPFTLALGWTLLHFLWQGLLAGLATALLLRLLRGHSAQVRHLAACAGLLACLLMPTVTLLQLLPGRPSPLAELAAPPVARSIPPVSTAAPAPKAPLKERLEGVLRPALPWLVGTWVLGSLFFLLRLLGGCLWLQRLRASHSSPASREWSQRFTSLARRMDLDHCPELRVCGAVDGPLVHGWWHPIVFVPASLLTGLDPLLLEALLAHELAHIRRQDYLANLLQSLCETLLFFHPAVWWISARIRATREEACDDLAAKAIGEPRRLALALAELDLFQLPAPALGAHQGDLMTRISRLLNPTPPRPFLGSPLPAFLVIALLAPMMASSAPPPERPTLILRPADLVAQLDALAAREGIDPHLLRAIAEVESQYDPGAVSRLGSTGLLQVMPATARKYGAQDLQDPAQVMAAGARYLKFLLTRYNGDWTRAVAAYNGGEEALDAGKLSEETRRYVPAVLRLAQSKAVQADEGDTLPRGLPLAGAKTTKPFGMGPSGSHDGIDLQSAEGTPVQATGGGTVTFAGADGDRGLTVVVKHGQGLESLYSHLAEIRVKAGGSVARGTVLGTVGHTGKATGPHLHYEVRKEGKAVDPGKL
jgi:murein DD-endopeptidase MepM/ murein hydrolase activator NlpD/beta-lactamase regulating signal transducer with metallopeptidase domain